MKEPQLVRRDVLMIGKGLLWSCFTHKRNKITTLQSCLFLQLLEHNVSLRGQSLAQTADFISCEAKTRLTAFKWKAAWRTHCVALVCRQTEILKKKKSLLSIGLASHPWLLRKDNLFKEIIRKSVYEIKLCVALEDGFKNTTSSSKLKMIDWPACLRSSS